MSEQQKQGLHPKQTLTEAELMQLRALATVCEIRDGLDLRLNWQDLHMRPGDRTSDFLFYRDDRLIGFLSLDGLGFRVPEATGMVHPDERRQGIFTALVAAACEESRRNAAEQLIFFCQHQSASAKAFLEAHGAEYQFSEHKMRLEQAPTPPAPNDRLDFQVATTADIPALADILSEGFGMLIERLREKIAADMRRDTFRYYIAKVGGAPVGTLNVQFIQDNAFIYGFVILPEYRGQGYGRQILARTLAALAAERSRPIFLEVESNNTVALVLYQSSGFRTVETYDYYQVDLALR